MSDEPQLLKMIGRIYEAAADPKALGHLAPVFAREFDSDSGLLYIVLRPQANSTDLLLSATANFDDKAHAAYTGYYRPRNIWSNLTIEKRAPVASRVFQGTEVVDNASLRRTEIYNDYFRRIGMSHVLAGLFPVRSDETGVVAVHRSENAKDFTEEQRRMLAVLVPHLQRAVQIHQRLYVAEQQQAMSSEVLERLDLGIMVLDLDGRILFANAVGRRVLHAGAGLTIQRGLLRAQNAAQAPTLERTVRDAALASVGQSLNPGGFIVVSRPGKASMSLMVSPYRNAVAFGEAPRPQAMIIFSDPDAQVDVPEQALTRMFGLASAEARLLSALVGGQTMGDYADQMGISLNTAKTQMRQIFFKTGYNRQTDLIRAVLADPVMKLAGAQDYRPLAAAE